MDVLNFIKPLSNIKDIVVPDSDTGWLPFDEDGLAFVKPLWASSESGGWAVIFKWKAGFVAPAHKHLSSVHTYMISGKLQVRDLTLSAGDYIYEANGVIHGEVTAIEDAVHLNIGDGPILLFDNDSMGPYFGWEQVAAMLEANI